MKKTLAIAASLLAPLAFGQAVSLRGSGGYGVDSAYNRLYTNRTLVRFSGVVTGKIKAAPMNGMAEGASILVRVPKKGVVAVDLGPTWFIQNQRAKINVGDHVRVVGSKVRLPGQYLVLARMIVKKNQVLALRDASGVPYWDATARAQQIAAANANNANANNMIQGTIGGTQVFTIDNQPYVGYVVNTGNGGSTMVALAPQWFMNGQDVTFLPGQHISVVGGPAIQIGGGMTGSTVVVANSIYGPSGGLVLRNPDGSPVWLVGRP